MLHRSFQDNHLYNADDKAQGGSGQGDDKQAGRDAQGNNQDMPKTLEDALRLIQERDARISQLNHESMTRRLANEQLEQRMSALEQGQQQRAKQNGDWESLAKGFETELNQLKPQSERAKALEEKIKASNQRRIDALPEVKRTLVPTELPPEHVADYLDKNWSLLTRDSAGDLDQGAGGGSGKKQSALTESQREMAKLFGLKEEDVLKTKDNIQKEE